MHVCPQVPSLTQAVWLLGKVGYVEDDVPPLIGTAIANPLASLRKPSLRGYVLGDGDIEADHESQGYCQPETNCLTCIRLCD